MLAAVLAHDYCWAPRGGKGVFALLDLVSSLRFDKSKRRVNVLYINKIHASLRSLGKMSLYLLHLGGTNCLIPFKMRCQWMKDAVFCCSQNPCSQHFLSGVTTHRFFSGATPATTQQIRTCSGMLTRQWRTTRTRTLLTTAWISMGSSPRSSSSSACSATLCHCSSSSASKCRSLTGENCLQVKNSTGWHGDMTSRKIWHMCFWYEKATMVLKKRGNPLKIDFVCFAFVVHTTLLCVTSHFFRVQWRQWTQISTDLLKNDFLSSMDSASKPTSSDKCRQLNLVWACLINMYTLLFIQFSTPVPSSDLPTFSAPRHYSSTTMNAGAKFVAFSLEK